MGQGFISLSYRVPRAHGAGPSKSAPMGVSGVRAQGFRLKVPDLYVRALTPIRVVSVALANIASSAKDLKVVDV